MTDTAIAADKVAAYRATQYRIGDPEAFTLSIGAKSDALLQLYRKTGQDCGLRSTRLGRPRAPRPTRLRISCWARICEH
jgi:hypothetical protein